MREQPPNLLLLCENETAANIDRRTLRDAGFPAIQVMTSGTEAAAMLAGNTNLPADALPDIVICQPLLEDMEGERFCSIVRQNPRLAKLPLLLIISNNSEKEQLKTIDSGASAVIARPFSVDALRKTLDSLLTQIPAHREYWKESGHMNTEAFDEALATQGVLLSTERSPADYFRLGMRLLNENNWNMAIAAFEKALPDQEIQAEVQMGLAAANRGKGDVTGFKKWLAGACDTLVSEKRWTRARSAYAKLLQVDAAARNPFVTEAYRLIRLGDYEEAAHALVQGHNLMPKMQISERYARICLIASNPEAMYTALTRELEREGEMEFLGNEIRSDLNLQIRNRQERQKELAAERTSRLARNMGWEEESEIIKPATQAPPVQSIHQEILNKQPERKKQETPPVAVFDWQDEERPKNAIEEFAVSAQPEDDLFQGKSRFSDFMSMMRLTWRLDKESKNKK